MSQRRGAAVEWPGQAEWEAMKARGRNLPHHKAVAEVAFLTHQYRQMWRPMTENLADFKTIIQVLRAKKIPFVLTGAHGISGWTGRPRSTHDVNILVKPGRNLARAIKALKIQYPHLEVRQHFGVTSFFIPGEKESVIDVTYPHRADIAETLETAIWIGEGDEKYRIPTLEAALGNKYGAMLTLSRDILKRTQDIVDFSQMVKHSLDEGRQPIDLEILKVLGEMVWPSGGGDEILRFVADVKAGKLPNPTARAAESR